MKSQVYLQSNHCNSLLTCLHNISQHKLFDPFALFWAHVIYKNEGAESDDVFRSLQAGWSVQVFSRTINPAFFFSSPCSECFPFSHEVAQNERPTPKLLPVSGLHVAQWSVSFSTFLISPYRMKKEYLISCKYSSSSFKVFLERWRTSLFLFPLHQARCSEFTEYIKMLQFLTYPIVLY